ncbi:Crp/Fnr family transcriptional regulator [Sediminitomix flava]|uniref:CRP-like cAMP-binding protein n=1 Tax=Sediminitomix flava TaxID=379075 RepID=A0A315ZGS7_SEDFL|nr:Crp/Fnr family transcriptional regulator [Sediminitomix flava]PWJ44369.1 CRP-like cAMP-binding protein [Sediminitomix flava]
MNDIKQTFKAFLQPVISTEKIIDELLTLLLEISEVKEYEKGTNLLKEGEYCKNAYIIHKGFIRRYTLQDGKDITLEFAHENEMITSIYSITTGKASLDYLEAVENSTVIQIGFQNIQELYHESIDSLYFGRLLRDRYYLSLEKRILSLQMHSAKERYDDLMTNQPEVIQRASLGQIATYLGITQETLSRVRKKSK